MAADTATLSDEERRAIADWEEAAVRVEGRFASPVAAPDSGAPASHPAGRRFPERFAGLMKLVSGNRERITTRKGGMTPFLFSPASADPGKVSPIGYLRSKQFLSQSQAVGTDESTQGSVQLEPLLSIKKPGIEHPHGPPFKTGCCRIGRRKGITEFFKQ